MDTGSIVSFLAGIGFGSVVSASVQHYLNRRAKRQDQIAAELREAFIGLLEALKVLETSNTKEHAKRLGYWIARIQLVGSQRVYSAVEAWGRTDAGTPERKTAMDDMIATMRSDLGIQA
jgi:hypothetical protein